MFKEVEAGIGTDADDNEGGGGKIVTGEDVRWFVEVEEVDGPSLTKGDRVMGGGGVCRCIFILGLLNLLVNDATPCWG